MSINISHVAICRNEKLKFCGGYLQHNTNNPKTFEEMAFDQTGRISLIWQESWNISKALTTVNSALIEET